MIRAAAPLVALALLAGACGGQPRVGAGEDVGFCAAWDEWDALEEPQLSDRAETVRWAEGALRILDRIDLRVEIDDRAPPATLRPQLRRVERELRRYRDAVRSADDDEQRRRAAAELAAGPFDVDADALSTIQQTRCTAEDRA
jgi:hypothetical protein